MQDTEGKFYSGDAAREMIMTDSTKTTSQIVMKPYLPKYRVFIQSKGSGARFIKAHTFVLYVSVPFCQYSHKY